MNPYALQRPWYRQSIVVYQENHAFDRCLKSSKLNNMFWTVYNNELALTKIQINVFSQLH